MKHEKLKNAREIKGLTQADVAKKVGISLRNYQKYENEGRVPKATTAIDIAKALDTTVEILWSCNSKDSL